MSCERKKIQCGSKLWQKRGSKIKISFSWLQGIMGTTGSKGRGGMWLRCGSLAVIPVKWNPGTEGAAIVRGETLKLGTLWLSSYLGRWHRQVVICCGVEQTQGSSSENRVSQVQRTYSVVIEVMLALFGHKIPELPPCPVSGEILKIIGSVWGMPRVRPKKPPEHRHVWD